MDSYLEQATRLLYPDAGPRAIDVKFFFQESVSNAEALSRQVVASFDAVRVGGCVLDLID